MSLRLYTIGHSTHPIENFIALLAQHNLEALADVRSFPASRRWPQFNQAELQGSLESRGIGYRWLKTLGGRRKGTPESPHRAWTNPSFRSFADHTESAEFKAGFNELLAAASRWNLAIMCSEGLWWRCHRRIISDILVVAGWQVVHILPDGKTAGHRLAEFATAAEGRVIYDGGQARLYLK
jgi:uncharacterized protein (DUF488 family)